MIFVLLPSMNRLLSHMASFVCCSSAFWKLTGRSMPSLCLSSCLAQSWSSYNLPLSKMDSHVSLKRTASVHFCNLVEPQASSKMAAPTADMHYGIWVLTDEVHRLPSANVGAISERLWPECLGCFPHGWHKSALSAALRQTELVESAAEPVGERNQKRTDRLEPVAIVLMISLM